MTEIQNTVQYRECQIGAPLPFFVLSVITGFRCNEREREKKSLMASAAAVTAAGDLLIIRPDQRSVIWTNKKMK